MSRPISARIDTAALRHNLKVIRQHSGRARTMAVVKANAYGHDLLTAVKALNEADGFAVASIEEALQIRQTGWTKPILLLEGIFSEAELPLCRQHWLSMVVHNRQQLDFLQHAGSAPLPPLFIKLNSGMNRLGFTPADFDSALHSLRQLPGITEISLTSHFATADAPAGIHQQMQVINAVFAGLPYPKSLANSAAIFRHPDSHADWVRPGIALYGASPFSDCTGAQLGLRPVMTLTSRIIAVQTLQPGDALGYGQLWLADRPSRVGVVACGYADGYPRHATTGTPIWIAGHKTRTLGRVSMDMLFTDLTDLPATVGLGAEVILWGEQQPVEQVASAAGTISYELLCARAPRVNPTIV